jgi:hypothetical protein
MERDPDIYVCPMCSYTNSPLDDDKSRAQLLFEKKRDKELVLKDSKINDLIARLNKAQGEADSYLDSLYNLTLEFGRVLEMTQNLKEKFGLDSIQISEEAVAAIKSYKFCSKDTTSKEHFENLLDSIIKFFTLKREKLNENKG